MGMMINRRRVCGGKSLPYDAEIEYLYSGGQSYIDSGIECTGDLFVRFNGMVPDNNVSFTSIHGGITIIDNTVKFRHHWSIGYNNSYNNFSYIISEGNNVMIGPQERPSNKWYDTYIMSTDGIAIINNVQYTFTPVSANLTTSHNYGIFNRISNTGALVGRSSYLSYFKMWRNGVLLRDYIPVRKGTTGYLYDKVSGQLFGNQGTGDFILGADK